MEKNKYFLNTFTGGNSKHTNHAQFWNLWNGLLEKLPYRFVANLLF
jgi:hypothetical protein